MECEICGYRSSVLLGHIKECHGLTYVEYTNKYKNKTIDDEVDESLLTPKQPISLTDDQQKLLETVTSEIATIFSISSYEQLEDVTLLYLSDRLVITTLSHVNSSIITDYVNQSIVSGLLPYVIYADLYTEEIKESLIESLTGTRKIKVYVAGPYFTDDQKKTLDDVYDKFNGSNIFKLYFPFRHGLDYRKLIQEGNDPEKTAELIFVENLVALSHADLIVSLIDDKDTGTSIEIGIALKNKTPVITYSSNDYGVNLMLASSVLTHTKTLKKLENAMNCFYDNFNFIKTLYSQNNLYSITKVIQVIKDKLPEFGNSLTSNK